MARLKTVLPGLAAAAALAAQTAAPSFTRESMLPSRGNHTRSLIPGEIVTIYGQNLAPPGCMNPPLRTPGIYPTELCGVQVTVAGVPSGLLAVLERQINFQVPASAPASGEAPVVVTVRGVSSPPVMAPCGKPKLTLSLAAPAYVHMPVWIAVGGPFDFEVRYPYRVNPASFGDNVVEVRRNGVPLKPLAPPRERQLGGSFGGSIAPEDAPPDRLPLHLQYRFDLPGKYEVRFTNPRAGATEWTEIEILPYSEDARRAAVRDQIAKMPASPGLLVGDFLPGLLAQPDELVLPAIVQQLYHSSSLVRRYAAVSLTLFDDAPLRKELTRVVREKGPTDELARIFDQREDLFEGGHEALLRTLGPYLSSPSPMAQTGALEYLVWAQNHDWGRAPAFQRQLAGMLVSAADNVLTRGDATSPQMLAEALGSLKTDATRELLWKMIDGGVSEEQSRIAMTWIGDVRDLPRLAALLLKEDPADPSGARSSSLCYSLHRAWADASLPYLKQIARDTSQVSVRTACARELAVANQPDGFRFLLQAIGERASVKQEVVQFLRDRFPELREASEEAVLASLQMRARQ